jgi:diguanylate cyclase (GGDEF)-like protein
MRWLLAFLERRTLPFIITVVITLLGLAAALEIALPPTFPSVIFYLPPIALAAWYGGRPGGLAVTIVALALWSALEQWLHSLTDVQFAWSHGLSHFALYLLLVFMLAAVRESFRAEWRRSRRDPLTDLCTRLALHEVAEVEFARARRYHHPLAVAYIDVDNFKVVNDTRGHAAGDALLRHIAHVLHTALRRSDVAARVGGDEFVVVYPETDAAGAKAAAEDLCDRLRVLAQETDLPVSLSIGVVSYARPPPSLDVALHRADGLMYRAKQAGKNTVVHERGDLASL